MDALISLVYTIIDSVCVCLFLDAFASHRWRDHRFLVGVIVQTILMYTLDFIAHGFCAGIAEMDMNLVGRLTDFLYHRWRVFRRSGRSNGVCHLHSTGFFVHGAPFSERVCAAR